MTLIRPELDGEIIKHKYWNVAAVHATVKQTLEESCLQILRPSRRVDIMRDARDARDKNRPYSIVFFGVNGVGKSTNLAKVLLIIIA